LVEFVYNVLLCFFAVDLRAVVEKVIDAHVFVRVGFSAGVSCMDDECCGVICSAVCFEPVGCLSLFAAWLVVADFADSFWECIC